MRLKKYQFATSTCIFQRKLSAQRDTPRRLYEDDIFNSTLGGSKQKREYQPKRKQASAT